MTLDVLSTEGGMCQFKVSQSLISFTECSKVQIAQTSFPLPLLKEERQMRRVVPQNQFCCPLSLFGVLVCCADVKHRVKDVGI